MTDRLCYHYTDEEHLIGIKESQALRPTVLWNIRHEGSDNIFQQLYSHALPDHPRHYGWIATGLLGFLGDATNVLEFKLKTSDGILVREAYHLSADNMIKTCGKNLWDSMRSGMEWREFVQEIPYLDYIRSTMYLQQYKDTYRVPEIMVPYTIPISDINLMNKSEVLQLAPHKPLIHFPVSVVADLQ